MRDGEVDVVAAGAHTPLTVFPQWQGAKLVVALAQRTPWLLIMRADIPTPRGGLQAVKGFYIGAVPRRDAALRHLLTNAGLDLARDDIHIGPVPGHPPPAHPLV